MNFWQTVEFWYGIVAGIAATTLFWAWSITIYRMGESKTEVEEEGT